MAFGINTKIRSKGYRWTRNSLILIVILVVAALLIEFEYAYVPPLDKVMNSQRINQDLAYDVWGRPVTRQEADKLVETQEGRLMLSAYHGAVEIDEELLRLGRASFYTETFGN